MCPQDEPDRDDVLARLHLVEGMLRALNDKGLVNLIDECAHRQDARDRLIASGYSEIQADRVLDMTLSRRTLTAREDLAEQERWLRSQLSD